MRLGRDAGAGAGAGAAVAEPADTGSVNAARLPLYRAGTLPRILLPGDNVYSRQIRI